MHRMVPGTKLLTKLSFIAFIILFVFHLYRVLTLNNEIDLLSGNLTEARIALEMCHDPNGDSSLLAGKNKFENKFPVHHSKREEKRQTERDLQKLVHLDLKGAPPTIEYLVQILPYLKKLGATAVLIEYEDMFPYHGKLKNIASNHAYQRNDINLLLKAAREHSLDVIPLLQSFGHLEFVLKHEEFSKLREVPRYFDMLCPSNEKSQDLIFEMIDQVLRMHPGITRLHIGGDEVLHLQMCKTCFQSRKSKVDLYLQHMIPILKHVSSKSNGKVTPIIWDDMLRKFSSKQLRKISSHTEIMVWSYVPDVARSAAFPDNMWKKYALAFDKIWIASSFKGGYLPNQVIPPVKIHIENNISWLKLISALPDNLEVIGIALTGWARFDHFAALCELLPVAIPSLAICLHVLKVGSYDKYISAVVADRLGLDSGIQSPKEYFSNYVVESGTFPGANVYATALELENHISWYNNINIRMDSWGNKRQTEQNATSFAQIEGVGESLKQLVQSLERFSDKARNSLQQVFVGKDVEEWMQDKVYYLIEKTKELVVRADSILRRNSYD